MGLMVRTWGSLSFFRLWVGEPEHHCGIQNRHGGGSHSKHQGDSMLSEERGLLGCPKGESHVLGADGVETKN